MTAFAIGAAVCPPTPFWFSRKTAIATRGRVCGRKRDERRGVAPAHAGLGGARLAGDGHARDLRRGAGPGLTAASIIWSGGGRCGSIARERGAARCA